MKKTLDWSTWDVHLQLQLSFVHGMVEVHKPHCAHPQNMFVSFFPGFFLRFPGFHTSVQVSNLKTQSCRISQHEERMELWGHSTTQTPWSKA